MTRTLRTMAGGALILALAALGCSKTQDTAPEARVFGQPPTIQSVDLSASPNTITCDWTKFVFGWLCIEGLPPSSFVTPTVPIEIHVTYDEATFSVRVSDPESTPAQSDVLLVTASYIITGGQPQEISLVVLDDGSTNQFVYTQKGVTPEDCPVAPTGACPCSYKQYGLDSNDVTANDGIFFRHFAFFDESGLPASDRAKSIARDCVVNATHQYPQNTATSGASSIQFKVEATDREGNIATWPVKPTINIAGLASMTCTGDNCACCLMTFQNDISECSQKDGLLGTVGSGFETGFCKTF